MSAATKPTAKTSACVRDITAAAKRIAVGIPELKLREVIMRHNEEFRRQLLEWALDKIDWSAIQVNL